MKPLGFGLFSPWYILAQNWQLLLAMTGRDIAARYRGSMLGVLWSVITPLIMLAVFDFVFTHVFEARWGIEPAEGKSNFTLILFTGLVIFNFFSEVIVRSPTIITENASFVKKIIFPVEILPIMVVFTALINAGISFCILMAGYLIFIGPPPITLMVLPAIAVPLILVTVGCAWLLAALGVFLRDINQMMGVVSTILLFMSGVFFPLEVLPPGIRIVSLLSPITLPIQQTRTILFDGVVPDPIAWGVYTAIAGALAWLGATLFNKLRDGFADVV